jgi:hypothetical protein
MATTSKPARVLPPTHIPSTRSINPAFSQPEVGLMIGEEARLLGGGEHRTETLRRGRAAFIYRCMWAPWDRGGCSS